MSRRRSNQSIQKLRERPLRMTWWCHVHVNRCVCVFVCVWTRTYPSTSTYASMVLKIEHIKDGQEMTLQNEMIMSMKQTLKIFILMFGGEWFLPHLKAIMMTSARMVPCMNLWLRHPCSGTDRCKHNNNLNNHLISSHPIQFYSIPVQIILFITFHLIIYHWFCAIPFFMFVSYPVLWIYPILSDSIPLHSTWFYPFL